MSYNWTKADIGVVQRHLRELNGNKVAVTEELLELVPTLKLEEIAIAIEIAEHERLYEKGELSLENLKESQARLGLNQKEANRYNHL